MRHFVVAKENNPGLIRKVLLERGGWKELPAEQTPRADLIWRTLALPPFRYQQLSLKNQSSALLINRFENNQVISTKSGLLKTIRSHPRRADWALEHVHPVAFLLGAFSKEQQEFETLFGDIEAGRFEHVRMPRKHCSQNLWIVKPEKLSQGRGISLHRTLAGVLTTIGSRPGERQYCSDQYRPKVPGRKFDIRAWVLVTPAYQVYFHTKPYLRTASVPYSNAHPEDPFVHLTNNCLQRQKKNMDYQKYQPGNTLPFSSLDEVLTAQFGKEGLAAAILQRMKEIAFEVLAAAKKPMHRSHEQFQFELLGFDFILDQDLRVWLLQVNDNPYLGAANQYCQELVQTMLKQLFDLVLPGTLEPPSQVQPTLFQLLVEKDRQKGKRARLSTKLIPMQDQSTKPEEPLSQTACIRTVSLYQSIKHVNTNYPYADFDPYLPHIASLLHGLAGSGSDQLLKTIELVCQTRSAGALANPKFLPKIRKVLVSATASPQAKALLLKAFKKSLKEPQLKKAVLNELFPDVLRLIEQQPPEQLLLGLCEFLLVLAGRFSRNAYIPGQTRQYQKLRNFFIDLGGLSVLLHFADKLSLDLTAFGKQDWQRQIQVAKRKVLSAADQNEIYKEARARLAGCYRVLQSQQLNYGKDKRMVATKTAELDSSKQRRERQFKIKRITEGSAKIRLRSQSLRGHTQRKMSLKAKTALPAS